MKKSLALFSAAILLAVPLTGCGNSKSSKIETADDLKGKIIGTQQGTTGYIFASDVENASVEPFDTAEEAVEALLKGKVDAVITDAEPAKVFVDKHPQLKILDEPFAEENYSIAYNNENFALGKKLNDSLRKLQDDGTISAIRSNWIGMSANQKSYEDKNPDTSKGTLTMATNAEFPPFEDEVDGKIVGFDVDIMNAICDELSMELVIEDMPFDTIISTVAAKKADVGVAAISVTQERSAMVSFTDTYASTTQVILIDNTKK